MEWPFRCMENRVAPTRRRERGKREPAPLRPKQYSAGNAQDDRLPGAYET